MSNVVGKVEVEVNASLMVNEETFKTCMSLIAMYMKNKGMKIMTVTRGEEFWAGYSTTMFDTEEVFWESFGGMKKDE